jgi:hypothetical protein
MTSEAVAVDFENAVLPCLVLAGDGHQNRREGR